MKYTYIVSTIATMAALAANAEPAKAPTASAVSPNKSTGVELVSYKNETIGIGVPSIVSVSQPIPFLKEKKNVIVGATAGNVNSVAVFPGLNAGIEVGQVSVLGGMVQAGKVNSVGIGDLRVTQTLPSVAVGFDVNKEKIVDLSLKNGLGVTLPFVSVNIPWPKFGK